MSKFKVGDEVAIAAIVKITAIQPNNNGTVSYSTDRGIAIHENLLEQIEIPARPADRMMGREEPKPKPAAPATKFKVGDRVVTKFGNGTVVEINYQHELIAYTVEHDNASDMLHSGRWDLLNSPGFSPNRCYFFSEHDLSPAPEPKYYTGKVFAVRTLDIGSEYPERVARNGHIFEICNGQIVGNTEQYRIGNCGIPYTSFSDFCSRNLMTEWAEVKE